MDRNRSKLKEDLAQVELPPSITVRQIADMLKVEPVKIIKQLMRKGIMANVNQVIDFDTASTIAADFGYSTKAAIEQRASPLRREEEKGRLPVRPPVVTIMGHVDHGKTTLLDVIRKTNVTAQEVGAITQHIGAYQTIVDGRKITFLDTPGHEAFTAMRARGAQATDIVVLVVAADDGVMPQTTEAINHARAAEVPIVIAINKIDKPDANPERAKQQLADLGLVVEEWGGDTVCVPISAKQEHGIPDLLENIFLVADILELKADPDSAAEGVVIEAKLDKTKGPLATFLVQKGTLRRGNIVVAGDAWGRIKAMFDDKGKQVHKAEPSTPVEVLGLNAVATSGDLFTVLHDEHEARSIGEKQKYPRPRPAMSLSALSSQISDGHIKELNIVLKTDVEGSIGPIKTSVEKLGTDKAKARVVHAASGSITESDVLLASVSKGIIIGFNTLASPGATQLANTEGVGIQHYDVIYKLIEDVDRTLKGMLEPTYAEVLSGRAEVRAIFPSSKAGKIAGVYVIEGKVSRDSQVKILRQNKVIAESRVSSLKRFKEDVAEVSTGLECGLGIEESVDFQIGDIIEFYRKERVG
ncbi:MAG: translation initiation factor IF-2 [Dehalococcoidia bacterium]